MANKKYAVVRTDLLAGTAQPAALENGRYYDASGTQAAIQNGSIVQVGALESGERESHKYTDVASAATLKDVVLIAESELYTNTTLKTNLCDYTNEAGKCIRGYYLTPRAEFSVTAEGFSDASKAAVGSIVYVEQDTHILAVSDSAPSAGLVIGEIQAIETVSMTKYYVICVK